MNGHEFNTLNDKLGKIHIAVTEIKGNVKGHSNRIETCEKDRDALFNSRNNHETRLTAIETLHKAREKYDGKERRSRTVTFDWIMRIVIALFMLGALLISLKNTYNP